MGSGDGTSESPSCSSVFVCLAFFFFPYLPATRAYVGHMISLSPKHVSLTPFLASEYAVQQEQATHPKHQAPVWSKPATGSDCSHFLRENPGPRDCVICPKAHSWQMAKSHLFPAPGRNRLFSSIQT